MAVSPSSTTLASGASQQFRSTVSNTWNPAVSWTASIGSVDSTGLFTARVVYTVTTGTVTATSQADGTQSASATITVQQQNVAPTCTFSVSPNPVLVNHVVTATESCSDLNNDISSITIRWGDGGTITGITSGMHMYNTLTLVPVQSLHQLKLLI